MLKAVIFDWDGTLYDSITVTYESYLKVMRAFGLPDITIDEFRAQARPNYHEYYLFLGIQESDWEAADKIWMNYYAHHKSACSLFHGVADTLAHLKEMNLTIGLVSSGSRERVMTELCEQGLNKEFDIMLFGDDVGFKKGKPEPDTLLMAIERMNVQPSDVMYVGDMVEDVLMAKSAGTKTAVVLSGFATIERLRDVGPDVIVRHVRFFADAAKRFV